MRRYFLIMGALVLMLSLIAACGDDDDNGDDDIADDITVTVPDVDDEATEADDADMTATTDDGAATGTEADMAEGTMDEDATGTESDGAAGTMDEDATGTEDMDADGTATDDDDRATGTDDDADATMDDDDATEDADMTGTEEDMAEGTAEAGGGFGEPVTVGDFILTVNDVMVLESGGVVAPDEGNQFLGVEMTIENTGTEQVGLARALLQTHLEDDDGEEYDIDLAATAIAIFSGGFDAQAEIEPGAEITGVAGFQVPEDLSPQDLTLVIEPEGADRIEIPLNGDDDTP